MPARDSAIEIDWSSSEQQQPGQISDRQAASQEGPEASEGSRRKDMGASSAFQAATEEGQRAVESKKDSADAMAEAELSSLDEELNALGVEGSSRNTSAAETSRPTPVVEPDAIVVSSTRGALLSHCAVACFKLRGPEASASLTCHAATGICERMQCHASAQTCERAQAQACCVLNFRRLADMLQASLGVVWQGNHKCCAGSERKGEDATTALRRARFLRVKITETATGSVRLETRLPSQFVDGMATVIPQVGTMCRGNAA